MADLNILRERIRGRYTIGWARMGERLQTRLKETGPDGTGELNRNTTVRPAGPFRLDVRVAVDYASFVKDGTSPHEIRPTTRSFLAFQWPQAPDTIRKLPDGRALARRVQHPGTDPNPWYDNALAQRGALLEDVLGGSDL